MSLRNRIGRIERTAAEVNEARRCRVYVLRRGETSDRVPAGSRIIREGPPDSGESGLPPDVAANVAAGRCKLVAGVDPDELV